MNGVTIDPATVQMLEWAALLIGGFFVRHYLPFLAPLLNLIRPPQPVSKPDDLHPVLDAWLAHSRLSDAQKATFRKLLDGLPPVSVTTVVSGPTA